MTWIPAVVFLLCLVTSIACAWLLFRAWREARTRLLLWSAAAFALLAVNNLLLVVDRLVVPTQVDLWPFRQLASLAAICVLLYGFITEGE